MQHIKYELNVNNIKLNSNLKSCKCLLKSKELSICNYYGLMIIYYMLKKDGILLNKVLKFKDKKYMAQFLQYSLYKHVEKLNNNSKNNEIKSFAEKIINFVNYGCFEF